MVVEPFFWWFNREKWWFKHETLWFEHEHLFEHEQLWIKHDKWWFKHEQLRFKHENGGLNMTNDGLWNMVVSLVEVWNMWIKSWTNVVYAMNHWGFAFHEFNDGMIWCDNNRRIFNGNNGMMPEFRKICETDLWALEQSFGDPLDPFRFCWLHHFWLRKTWYCNCSLVIEAAHFQSTNPIWDERWDIYIL